MQQLYDVRGQHKYLTQHERDRFPKAARSAPTPVRAFCEVLAYTGCRISEALALTPERVDAAAGVVVLESLKKRRRGVFRAVPVPTGLLETLARLQLGNARFGLDSTLWSWSRTTAWRRVRAVMRAAEVDGAAATPRGLRHTFGIVAVAAAVPLTIIQKWMGHSDVATTAIYLDVSAYQTGIGKRHRPLVTINCLRVTQIPHLDSSLPLVAFTRLDVNESSRCTAGSRST